MRNRKSINCSNKKNLSDKIINSLDENGDFKKDIQTNKESSIVNFTLDVIKEIFKKLINLNGQLLDEEYTILLY